MFCSPAIRRATCGRRCLGGTVRRPVLSLAIPERRPAAAAHAARRIAIVSNTGWSIIRFRADLIAALIDRGWEVCAVGDFTEEQRDRVLATGARAYPLPIDAAGLNPARDLGYILRLARLLRDLRPDIVHLYTIKPVVYGGLAAKMTGVPAIVASITGAGVFHAHRRKWLRPVLSGLIRTALAGRPMVIFQNPDDMKAFTSAGLVSSAQATCIAGSGVDTVALSPDESVPCDRRTQFVMASRALWSKGVAEFVEAARTVKRQHPDASFVLFGGTKEDYGSKNPDFVDRAWLEAVNREGFVDWRGWTDPREVEAAMRGAAAVVLPSWYAEGVPRSLLEAASAGVPIITTDMPGCRDAVISGVSGFLCPPKSPTSLAGAICELLKNPQCIAAMGKAGRRLAVERFDSRIIIAETLATYERALGACQRQR